MNDFTLLIPTFNRPQYVARLLAYYRRVGLDAPIVVADSSAAPAIDQNAARAAELPNVKHVRYPSEINPYSKISSALEAIPTSLVAICGDDDFLVPAALERCVEWLAGHADHSIAHGLGVVLSSPDGHTVRTTAYRQTDVSEDDPLARVTHHLRHYATTFYSVHQRSHLLRNMGLSGSRTTDYKFGEILGSCLSLIQGKAKRIDQLYMVRTDNPVRESNTLVDTLARSWARLLVDVEFSTKYTRFRTTLVEELALLGVTGAERALDEAFIDFFSARLRPVPSGIARVRAVASEVANVARRGLALVAAGARQTARGELPRSLRGLTDASDPMSVGRLLAVHDDFRPIYDVMRAHGA